MRKRDFLAAMAAGTLATGVAKADDYIHGKNLGAAPPQKKKDAPHRKVTPRNLFKVPHGYPNGVAIAPEGLWVGEQKAQGYGKDGGRITEDAWLVANGGQVGGFVVDMDSKLVSHRQIPLGPSENGGGCHGLMWHEGKLW